MVFRVLCADKGSRIPLPEKGDHHYNCSDSYVPSSAAATGLLKDGTKEPEHGLIKCSLSYLMMRREDLFSTANTYDFLRSNQVLFLPHSLFFRLLKMLLFTQEMQI